MKSPGSYKKFHGRNPYNIFVAFLVKTMTPKKHFEINWPLVVAARAWSWCLDRLWTKRIRKTFHLGGVLAQCYYRAGGSWRARNYLCLSFYLQDWSEVIYKVTYYLKKLFIIRLPSQICNASAGPGYYGMLGRLWCTSDQNLWTYTMDLSIEPHPPYPGQP